MSPHGFGHLYEIFATFTIAYILIDEFSENSFIRQISEKVLKKYSHIQDMFEDVRSTITGQKTSLTNIPKLGLKDPSISPDTVKHLTKIKSTERKVEKTWNLVQFRIKKNYKSGSFILLNFYILLYCLAMLYFGGIYESMIHNESHLEQIDATLFIFLFFSLIFLVYGWIVDTTKNKRNESFEDILSATITTTNGSSDKTNVYIRSTVFFLILVVVCTCWYYFIKIHFFNTVLKHEILILSSVFLPATNFVAYFFKAKSRANKTLTVINDGCALKCREFNGELEIIESFVSHCKYLKSKDRKISIIDSGPIVHDDEETSEIT